MKNKSLLVLLLSIFLLLVTNYKPVQANGTKTQVYIANEIIAELEKNKDFIEIEGIGKMAIEPSIRDAILNQKDAFRAGAVGPDFYPSFLVGLRGIHANESGYYLEELIKNYIANPPADANERQKIEAFLLGMQVHYAGDTVSRREFNELAKGNFPRIAANMNKDEANVVLRYTAIEGYYDSILPNKGYSYKISAPVDFVAKHMVFNGEYGGKIKRELNYKYKYSKEPNKTKVGTEIPLVLFTKYHNEIIKSKDQLYKDRIARTVAEVVNYQGWINNIERSIRKWISTNERAASRVLNGEATAFALGNEYKNFIDKDFKMLLPAGKIIGYVKKYTPAGIVDELTGASDYITGELTDLIVGKISYGKNVKANSNLVELILNDSALFKEGSDSIKEKIKIAGDKSLEEALNLSKLLLLKKTELAKIPDIVGVNGNGRWLKLETLKPNKLMEVVTKRSPLEVRIITKKNTGWFGAGSNGTDGDVYARIYYGNSYKDHLLDKGGYNDFEAGDDDTYTIYLEPGRKYSDVTAVRVYKKNGDEWGVYSARVYVHGKEFAYKKVDRGVGKGGFEICKQIKGFEKYDPKPRNFGNLHIMPEFFSTVYSLDKKDGINNNFILCETPEIKEKVYNCVVAGAYKPDKNVSVNKTEELSCDFTENVNITPFDGLFGRSSKYGFIMTDLGNKTHGLAVLDDSYFKNGTIEATIQLETTKDGFLEGNGGFNFRVSDPGHGPNNHKGYYVGIKASANGKPGEVMIGSSNSGKWRCIKTCNANISFGKDYKLKVVAEGIYMDVYLDGKKVMSITDLDHKEGQIGFSMWKSHPIYKNLEVKN